MEAKETGRGVDVVGALERGLGMLAALGYREGGDVVDDLLAAKRRALALRGELEDVVATLRPPTSCTARDNAMRELERILDTI
jgi:hypothetical protein